MSGVYFVGAEFRAVNDTPWQEMMPVSFEQFVAFYRSPWVYREANPADSTSHGLRGYMEGALASTYRAAAKEAK